MLASEEKTILDGGLSHFVDGCDGSMRPSTGAVLDEWSGDFS